MQGNGDGFGFRALYRLGMQDYRKLWVWQRAHVLAIQVRRATRAFPRAEYGPLRTQMIHAAESIVFNIVEGRGSQDNGVLRPALCQSLTATTMEIRKMICGLRKKVLRPPNQDPPNQDPPNHDPPNHDPPNHD